jgi:tyrosyl-tRNA synthetase
MKTYETQVFKILDHSKTEVRYNSEWLGKMSVMEFLQLGGKYTVARMMERNDFEKRHEAGDDVSVMEFYYPLMQAYDSVALKADVELGGNDQKFNLLLGRTIQKRMGQQEQVVMTLPLLEGTDGVQKMSKSYGNYIGITESPQEMFGKLLSITDELMWRYYELLSTKTLDEIKTLKAGHPKAAKVALAKEIVTRFHSATAADDAEHNFEQVFAKKGLPDEIPTETIIDDTDEIGIVNILNVGSLCKSRTEARSMISQNAVEVDGEKIVDVNAKFSTKKDLLVKVGKRRFAKIKFKRNI